MAEPNIAGGATPVDLTAMDVPSGSAMSSVSGKWKPVADMKGFVSGVKEAISVLNDLKKAAGDAKAAVGGIVGSVKTGGGYTPGASGSSSSTTMHVPAANIPTSPNTVNVPKYGWGVSTGGRPLLPGSSTNYSNVVPGWGGGGTGNSPAPIAESGGSSMGWLKSAALDFGAGAMAIGNMVNKNMAYGTKRDLVQNQLGFASTMPYVPGYGANSSHRRIENIMNPLIAGGGFTKESGIQAASMATNNFGYLPGTSGYAAVLQRGSAFNQMMGTTGVQGMQAQQQMYSASTNRRARQMFGGGTIASGGARQDPSQLARNIQSRVFGNRKVSTEEMVAALADGGSMRQTLQGNFGDNPEMVNAMSRQMIISSNTSLGSAFKDLGSSNSKTVAAAKARLTAAGVGDNLQTSATALDAAKGGAVGQAFLDMAPQLKHNMELQTDALQAFTKALKDHEKIAGGLGNAAAVFASFGGAIKSVVEMVMGLKIANRLIGGGTGPAATAERALPAVTAAGAGAVGAAVVGAAGAVVGARALLNINSNSAKAERARHKAKHGGGFWQTMNAWNDSLIDQGIGKYVPLFNMEHNNMSAGGMVPGNHNNDTVPISATPGEVVVPVHTVNRNGGPAGVMSKLNFGGRRGYANGGEVWGKVDDSSQEGMFSSHGASFQANKRAGGQFTSFLNELWDSGYHFQSVGGFRTTQGGGLGPNDPPSNHRFGIAIDVDPSLNPFFYNPSGGAHAIPDSVGPMANKHGLRWGGNYHSRKDYMHFEIQGGPAADTSSGAGSPAAARGASAHFAQAFTRAIGAGNDIVGNITNALSTLIGSPLSPGSAGGTGSGNAAPNAVAGTAPSAPSSPGGNAALAKKMAAAMGWTGSNWDSLYALWNQESGFNTHAGSPGAAYGIPQALPGNKMSSAGSDWLNNPATQIKWGLGYIKDRYGDPNGAEAHKHATDRPKHGSSSDQPGGWYAQGSWEIEKDQTARIHKGEMILPADAAESVRKAAKSGARSGGGDTYNFNIALTANGASDAEAEKLARTIMQKMEQMKQHKMVAMS